MPSAPSRRLVIALAASLGVHGFLWLVVEGFPPEVRPPPPVPAATLEWVEVEVATPPESKPASQEPPRVAERPPRDEAPRRPAPPAATKAPPEPPPAVAEARPAQPSDVPRADAPRADLFPSDVPRADAPSGSSLLMAAREATAPVHRERLVATLDAGVPEPGAPPSAQEIVQELVSEGIGRGRVARGQVHPYFSQLGKALMKAWDADRAVKENGLQGYFGTSLERTRAYSKIWLERAEAYGSSGAFGLQGTTAEDKRRPQSNIGDPALQARREMRKKMREEFRATRRAVLRVEQDTEGRLLDVKLVDPSNDEQVDREALKDVRAAAERLPPVPAEAVRGRERIISLWQFELIISISPPIPTFTFEFDEALGFIDTRMPLDRRIYKRVRLLEVR